MKKITFTLIAGLLLNSCSDNQYESNKNKIEQMETSKIVDVHSYAEFDKAYIDVFKKMPKWSPGQINGEFENITMKINRVYGKHQE